MTEQSISGMTVNERLFYFGLIDRFDVAALARDVSAMVAILRQAQLSETQAIQTAQAVAESPKRYGY